MEELVIRLNIQRYRKMLAQDDDETKQRTLLRLLAEEETKLAEYKVLRAVLSENSIQAGLAERDRIVA
jgi:hypothetical protein